MTISGRNFFFKISIALSIGLFGGIIAATYAILPLLPNLAAQAVQRSTSLVNRFPLLEQVPLVPIATTLASILYACLTLGLIYYLFEKTQSPEILFIAFFTFSLAFEAIRIMVPLQAQRDLPVILLIITHRFLIFSRCFGVYSLFFASVCASGLEIQRYSTIILIQAVTAFVIAIRIPIEGIYWDTAFKLISGYQPFMRVVEGSISAITVLSFIIAGYSRDSREYYVIGIGSLLAFIGRALLINADTWIVSAPGFAILLLGTWFICKKLHQVYMWL